MNNIWQAVPVCPGRREGGKDEGEEGGGKDEGEEGGGKDEGEEGKDEGRRRRGEGRRGGGEGRRGGGEGLVFNDVEFTGPSDQQASLYSPAPCTCTPV